MIIYQAKCDGEWVRDFELTFRIIKNDKLSLINSSRTRFEYMSYISTSYRRVEDIIYKG